MWWRRFWERARKSQESEQELESYLALETDANMARGMREPEAREAARRKLGNAGLIREEIYRMGGLGFVETVWLDLRYAGRGMRKNPIFTVVAVVTLALGIGGNAAIFTLVRGVLLKPLAYRAPERLVSVTIDNPQRNVNNHSFGIDQFREMKGAIKSFSGFGAYGSEETVMLSGGGEPEALKGSRLSANFLDILGVQPAAGRTFVAGEDEPGGPAVAMVSYGLWRRRFGGDPSIAGRKATLDSIPYTIVGVLPAGFQFPRAGVDVWVTRPWEWSALPKVFWGLPHLSGFARLRREVSVEEARTEMNLFERRYALEHPSPLQDARAAMRVERLKESVVGDFRPLLWMLFGAVGFVLLIACGNVAGLLLARATARSREFAVRTALGAGRGRLIRQLLAEGLALALGGGAAGLLLAKWVLAAVMRAGLVELPRSGEIELDRWVVAFTLVISLLTGMLFGLAPALQAARRDAAEGLRESGAYSGT